MFYGTKEATLQMQIGGIMAGDVIVQDDKQPKLLATEVAVEPLRIRTASRNRELRHFFRCASLVPAFVPHWCLPGASLVPP